MPPTVVIRLQLSDITVAMLTEGQTYVCYTTSALRTVSTLSSLQCIAEVIEC